MERERLCACVRVYTRDTPFTRRRRRTYDVPLVPIGIRHIHTPCSCPCLYPTSDARWRTRSRSVDSTSLVPRRIIRSCCVSRTICCRCTTCMADWMGWYIVASSSGVVAERHHHRLRYHRDRCKRVWVWEGVGHHRRNHHRTRRRPMILYYYSLSMS